MGGAAIRVSGLTKAFGARLVFEGLSFETPPGGSLALVGPSGCGKSTLLNILAGLSAPDAGRAEIEPPMARTAFMPQDYGLFPWKDVRSNLELPLRLRGAARPERFARASAMLAELGLAGLDNFYPGQLSGGQRQRVALGRALVAEPELLLLDEPFSSLDALTRENMQNLLADLRRRHGLTFVLATHFIEEAVFLGDHILVLAGSPARAAAAIDNPGRGLPESRFEESYFQTVKMVRQSLEENGAPRGADASLGGGARA